MRNVIIPLINISPLEKSEQKNISNFIDSKNRFIEKWLDNPRKTAKNHYIFKTHRGNGNKGLVYDYLPQPYVGDPFDASIVTLNLNPGPVIDKRKYPDGKYLHKLKEKGSYYSYAKEFPQLKPEETNRFWENQNKWVSRLAKITGTEIGNKKPFAMELNPWHSHAWKGYNSNDPELLSIFDKKIQTASIVSKTAKINLIIAIGKDYSIFLDKLGYQKEIEISHKTDEYTQFFPKKSDGSKVNRTFELRKKNNSNILVTYYRGGNKPPPSKFDEIQKIIFDQINVSKV